MTTLPLTSTMTQGTRQTRCFNQVTRLVCFFSFFLCFVMQDVTRRDVNDTTYPIVCVFISIISVFFYVFKIIIQ